MATLTFTVPDALVPRLVAARQVRYPERTGAPGVIARSGVRRLLQETLAAAESRAAELAAYDAMLAAAESARQQALVDAAEIT